jgi:hypothetical protein
MKFIQSLQKALGRRFQFLIRKQNHKKHIEKIIEKYKLNNPIEQQRLIEQYNLIQQNKRAFGRKARLHIEEKVSFMIHYKLIEIVE